MHAYSSGAWQSNGHRLLAIGAARAHALREEIGHGCEGVKPGWTRVNLNYFISAAAASYIADAVSLLAAKVTGCRRTTGSTRVPACGTMPAGPRRPRCGWLTCTTARTGR